MLKYKKEVKVERNFQPYVFGPIPTWEEPKRERHGLKMEELKQEKQEQNTPPMRGLYSKVKISVKTLNIIIVALVVLLIACMAFAVANGGFRVTFDTQGGTTVEMQKKMYGELIEISEPPTREGFVFDGWYLDPGATIPWNLEEDVVTESMTLYAGWKEE